MEIHQIGSSAMEKDRKVNKTKGNKTAERAQKHPFEVEAMTMKI